MSILYFLPDSRIANFSSSAHLTSVVEPESCAFQGHTFGEWSRLKSALAGRNLSIQFPLSLPTPQPMDGMDETLLSLSGRSLSKNDSQGARWALQQYEGTFEHYFDASAQGHKPHPGKSVVFCATRFLRGQQRENNGDDEVNDKCSQMLRAVSSASLSLVELIRGRSTSVSVSILLSCSKQPSTDGGMEVTSLFEKKFVLIPGGEDERALVLASVSESVAESIHSLLVTLPCELETATEEVEVDFDYFVLDVDIALGIDQPISERYAVGYFCVTHFSDTTDGDKSPDRSRTSWTREMETFQFGTPPSVPRKETNTSVANHSRNVQLLKSRVKFSSVFALHKGLTLLSLVRRSNGASLTKQIATFFDVPTLDLESSNMDSLADEITLSLLWWSLLSNPICADCLAEAPEDISLLTGHFFQLVSQDEGRQKFDEQRKAWITAWSKEFERLQIELDLNSSMSSCDDGAMLWSSHDYKRCLQVLSELSMCLGSSLRYASKVAWAYIQQHDVKPHDSILSSGSPSGMLLNVSPIVRVSQGRSEARPDVEVSPLAGNPSPLGGLSPMIGSEITREARLNVSGNSTIVLSPSAQVADDFDLSPTIIKPKGTAEFREESTIILDDSFSPARREESTLLVVASPPTDSVLNAKEKEIQELQNIVRELREQRAVDREASDAVKVSLVSEINTLKATLAVAQRTAAVERSQLEATAEQLRKSAESQARTIVTMEQELAALRLERDEQARRVIALETERKLQTSPEPKASRQPTSVGSESSGSPLNMHPNDASVSSFQSNIPVLSSPSALRAARKQRLADSSFAHSWSSDTSSINVAKESFAGSGTALAACHRGSKHQIAITKLCHTQALRRLIIVAEQQQDFASLVMKGSTQAVIESLSSVRQALSKNMRGVEAVLQEQQQSVVQWTERQCAQCFASVEEMLAMRKSSTQQHGSTSCDDSLRVPLPLSPARDVLLATTLSSGLQSPIPKLDDEHDEVQPSAAARRPRSLSRTHRLQSSMIAAPQERPESVQVLVMSGRNMKGEIRKAAGERCPGLKYDQIRSEAVSWKQQQLDEYKSFAAHQILFFGDAHVGKSSLIACLTTKAPKLFKKAPAVVTPTLEITRSRTTVHLTKQHGTPAMVPLGGIGRLTMSDVGRVVKEFSSVKEPAVLQQQHTLQQALNPLTSSHAPGGCSSQLVLSEYPSSVLRASAPNSLPRKGAIYVVTFRLSDGQEVSRQSILRHVQHILALTSIDIDAVEGVCNLTTAAAPTTLPFVLIGTHADEIDELRNEHDLTVVQRVLGSYREWLEDEFNALRQSGVVWPLVLDTFAVSCAMWTVSGERPKSAEDFQSLLFDWASYLQLHSPNAPEHFLPSLPALLRSADVEGPFSDDDRLLPDDSDEMDENSENQDKRKAIVAPALLDYFWARRGGGSQSGGLFAVTSSTTAAAAKVSKGESKSLKMRDVASRWLHNAANGLITLFTALYRFSEFTGFVLDGKMFDNIVLQHLELASRREEEQSLPKRLLKLRDNLVESMLSECRRRCLLMRLTVEHRSAEVILIGPQWYDSLVSSLMLPCTIQMASAMPTSAPKLRASCANVGPRHIVALIQRATSMHGLDLSSGSMPIELAAYRTGHVSRKLLFQLLPAPMNTIAATQRHTESLLATIGLTHIALVRDEGAAQRSIFDDSGNVLADNTSFSSVTSFGTNVSGGGLVRMTTASSSVFLPCVSSTASPMAVAFLDDFLHVIGENIMAAILQVDMPFTALFPRVQSRLFLEGVGNCGVGGDGAMVALDPASPAISGHIGSIFAGISGKNFFVYTANDATWVLIIAVGGTEMDCTFGEFRIVVVRHTTSAQHAAMNSSVRRGDDDATVDETGSDARSPRPPSDGAASPSLMFFRSLRQEVDAVCQAFVTEAKEFVGSSGDICRVEVTQEADEERRSVESWEETERKYDRLVATGSAALNQNAVVKHKAALRAMVEHTVAPDLERVVDTLFL